MNALNGTGLHTLKWLLVRYVNFTSTEKKEFQHFWRGFFFLRIVVFFEINKGKDVSQLSEKMLGATSLEGLGVPRPSCFQVPTGPAPHRGRGCQLSLLVV